MLCFVYSWHFKPQCGLKCCKSLCMSVYIRLCVCFRHWMRTLLNRGHFYCCLMSGICFMRYYLCKSLGSGQYSQLLTAVVIFSFRAKVSIMSVGPHKYRSTKAGLGGLVTQWHNDPLVCNSDAQTLKLHQWSINSSEPKRKYMDSSAFIVNLFWYYWGF